MPKRISYSACQLCGGGAVATLLVACAYVGSYALTPHAPPPSLQELLPPGAPWGSRGGADRLLGVAQAPKELVGASTVAHLSERLRRSTVRFGADLGGWEYGVPGAHLRNLSRHWSGLHDVACFSELRGPRLACAGFDWHKQQKLLMRMGAHRYAVVGGLRLHYVLASGAAWSQSVAAAERPVVLLLHGERSSAFEFRRAAAALQQRGVDVVVPSLPGFGLSDDPSRPGLSAPVAAAMLARLMALLGHRAYFVQGGDWGGVVGSMLAQVDAEHVRGLHLNSYPVLAPPWRAGGPLAWVGLWGETPWGADGVAFGRFAEAAVGAAGAFGAMAVRPQTLGHALDDSPLGLLAWMAEKHELGSECSRCGFHYVSGHRGAWRDCVNRARQPEHWQGYGCVDRDLMLTHATLYWARGGGAASSLRFVRDSLRDERARALFLAPVLAPAALADFPGEPLKVPSSWARAKYRSLRRDAATMPSGGRFAAGDQPKLLVADLLRFVQAVEAAATKASGAREL